MEEQKHLLSTNCPPPHIVRTILNFIPLILWTHTSTKSSAHPQGQERLPPFASMFIGKEKCIIISASLYLIQFFETLSSLVLTSISKY